ncbi:hypothetical protein GXW82_35015 [Streptacidiphilus sp. 4-A2]|nr:hypothetical protein [Streptacidiphilus sp. 4-A2]
MPDDQPHTRTRYPAGEALPDAPAGRHPLRTLAAVLGAVLLLLMVIAVVNRTSGSGNQAGAANSSGSGTASSAGSGTAQASATAPTGTQPVSTSQDGIATGFPHTSEGAQSAAVNYSVALGSSEMYTTASRHAILQTIMDPATEAQLQSTTDSQYASLNKTLGLNNGVAKAGLALVSRPLPVGTKADGYSGEVATVEVWSDQLGGLAGTGSTQPVTEYWYTLTMHMHWIDGDWKVTSYTTVDGPAPIGANQQVSSANAISGAVSQFGGFRYAR